MEDYFEIFLLWNWLKARNVPVRFTARWKIILFENSVAKRVCEESPPNDSIPAKRFPKASRLPVPARSPSSTQPWKEALQQCPRKEVRASIYALGQQLALSEFLSFPICSPFPFLSRWYIPGVKLFLYSNILSLCICIHLSTIIGNYEIILNSVKDLFRCLSLTENVRESVNRVESANSTLSLYNVKINFSMKKFLIEKIK